MKYDSNYFKKQILLGKYQAIAFSLVGIIFVGLIGWFTADSSDIVVLFLVGLVFSCFLVAIPIANYSNKVFWKARVKKTSDAEKEFTEYIKASAEYYGFESANPLEFKKKT